MKHHGVSLLAATAVLLSGTAMAQNEFEPQILEMFETQIRPLLGEAVLVDAVTAQNAEHAGLSDADIDDLDNTWREEADAGSGAMIDEVMARPLSEFLQQVQADSGGLITEIFVMDNRGLNVGQSALTSDYMQGDEAKWQETFQVGPEAIFVDELEFDESTNAFQSQVSGTIVDPATGEPIGAITVGVNVEGLL